MRRGLERAETFIRDLSFQVFVLIGSFELARGVDDVSLHLTNKHIILVYIIVIMHSFIANQSSLITVIQ
jgi:hypothetical protein